MAFDLKTESYNQIIRLRPAWSADKLEASLQALLEWVGAHGIPRDQAEAFVCNTLRSALLRPNGTDALRVEGVLRGFSNKYDVGKAQVVQQAQRQVDARRQGPVATQVGPQRIPEAALTDLVRASVGVGKADVVHQTLVQVTALAMRASSQVARERLNRVAAGAGGADAFLQLQAAIQRLG